MKELVWKEQQLNQKNRKDNQMHSQIMHFVSKTSSARQSKQKIGDVRVYIEHFLTEDKRSRLSY